MSKFKIKVARIETHTGSRAAPQVCITFQIERGEINFQLPIRLDVSDYDDTEMVQVARNILNRTFIELAAQSRDWRLSAKEMQKLSSMNLNPERNTAPASRRKR
jgi:hypothetical protein